MSTTIPTTTSPLSPILPAATSTAAGTTTSPTLSLQPSDFLNLMVTQLQNQDPTNPTSSSDLLAQMSQIGQLQASTTLQTTLQGFGLQTSLSSASSMIGKSVQGLDPNGNPLSGVVTSVQVQSGNVSLSLDNGQSLALSNVTSIAPGPAGTTAATTTAGGTTTTPVPVH
jgi:flagellar basal-body rod modification protein FlgD